MVGFCPLICRVGGQSVSGHCGSASIAVALATRAGCVTAPGRTEAVSANLACRFEFCVVMVKLTGEYAEDQKRIIGKMTVLST